MFFFFKKSFFLFSLVCLTSFFCNFYTCEELCKVEHGFSPEGSAIKSILRSIKSSKFSIKIAAYSFTNKDIAKEILNAFNRGVDIKIVADKKSNSNKHNILNYLASKGIKVRLNNHYSIMHNKFMIFDENLLETGSFNYSKSAVLNNAENVILIKNCPIVKSYLVEFDRLWNQSLKNF